MAELVTPTIPAGRLSAQLQPVLDADELTLRPWDPGDAEALVAAYADPDIRRWHVREMDAEEALAWVGDRAQKWATETGVDWAVVEREAVVGRVGFGAFNLVDGRAEVAYWATPSQRGRGISARALEAASTWMLSTGFHRLELTHSTANEASCRVAERAGYELEGTLRAHGLHADGWHDMHLHARLG